MFGRRHRMDLMDSDEMPRIALGGMDRVLDEYDAMRAVYATLSRFREPERRRILEAVESRLRDDLAVAAHAQTE